MFVELVWKGEVNAALQMYTVSHKGITPCWLISTLNGMILPGREEDLGHFYLWAFIFSLERWRVWSVYSIEHIIF